MHWTSNPRTLTRRSWNLTWGAHVELVSKRDPKLVKFVAPAVKPPNTPPLGPPSEYELMLEALLNPGNRVNGEIARV